MAKTKKTTRSDLEEVLGPFLDEYGVTRYEPDLKSHANSAVLKILIPKPKLDSQTVETIYSDFVEELQSCSNTKRKFVSITSKILWCSSPATYPMLDVNVRAGLNYLRFHDQMRNVQLFEFPRMKPPPSGTTKKSSWEYYSTYRRAILEVRGLLFAKIQNCVRGSSDKRVIDATGTIGDEGLILRVVDKLLWKIGRDISGKGRGS